MNDFSQFEFRTQPWFEQSHIQSFVRSKIPMKTIAIFCFDPRAEAVPALVAKHLENEVYPGEVILDEHGYKVGSTRTLFPLSNAGGRAIGALKSIATMEYLFGLENIVVVHHSFCGATSFTPDVLIDEFKNEQHVDIAPMFDRDSLSISDFTHSLKYDVDLLRASAAVPKHVKLFGLFFEINSGNLIEVVRDMAAVRAAA